MYLHIHFTHSFASLYSGKIASAQNVSCNLNGRNERKRVDSGAPHFTIPSPYYFHAIQSSRRMNHGTDAMLELACKAHPYPPTTKNYWFEMVSFLIFLVYK